MGIRGSIPLGHNQYPILVYESLRADGYLGPELALSGLDGDLEVELVVDGCLLGGPGVADDITQVAEGGDEGADVVFGEAAGRAGGGSGWRRGRGLRRARL